MNAGERNALKPFGDRPVSIQSYWGCLFGACDSITNKPIASVGLAGNLELKCNTFRNLPSQIEGRIDTTVTELDFQLVKGLCPIPCSNDPLVERHADLAALLSNRPFYPPHLDVED